MAQEQTYATGKRKSAIARVWITPGSGNVVVNKQPAENYFGNIFFEQKVEKPFAVTETAEQFDVMATVKGGGKSAQVDALVHGISRALQEMNSELRDSLKKAGLLTRDSRTKERKKYGLRGARARFQFSKR
ncbi:MAG: 30S ribosomal protein S9 [Candidatus Electrothrix aestuarii]|jgi:small subunit ribosomal protein S9|uniref:Small ribosomal subunit protein uS9 n=1 Tax=Candidatus Electrothrix aestuarii TaxID=3062594 RepID=A0AAU8LWT1_9BACT|nr:30S ribosomal protein S9 [Candidatus Electrothrix aestuarii]WPD22617.1 MAG: 30S ribosomal protein S9 [Candidatus Electrothrix sp. GW3-3]